MRVSSTSRSRIDDISRPISASVSSVSTYWRSDLNRFGVLDRDGDMRPELPQQGLILARERTGGLTQQVQRADDLPFAAHRHRELTQHVPEPRVARLVANVVHEDRPTFLDRGSHDALPDLEVSRRRHSVGITDGIRNPQLLAALVQEIDGEGAEPGQPRDELWNLGEELFEVEHGHDLAPQVEERRQEFRVGRRADRRLSTHGQIARTDYTEAS